MTSESDLKVVATAAASGHQSARSSQSKEDGDTDSATVNQPLDPLRKQWMLAAALRETSELAGMLMEDAKLADFKVSTCTPFSPFSSILNLFLFPCHDDY